MESSWKKNLEQIFRFYCQPFLRIWSKVVDNTTGRTGFVANDYIPQL